MTDISLETATASIPLTLTEPVKTMAGFCKAVSGHAVPKQYAKLLASAYLKFTPEGNMLSQKDSVDSFICLACLHEELAESASQFLQQDIHFVYDDQPLQPLLVPFATYRLETANAYYRQAVVQNLPAFVVSDLKQTIQTRQLEFEHVLQQG